MTPGSLAVGSPFYLWVAAPLKSSSIDVRVVHIAREGATSIADASMHCKINTGLQAVTPSPGCFGLPVCSRLRHCSGWQMFDVQPFTR